MATATNVTELASDGGSVYALDNPGGILYGCALTQCGSGGPMSSLATGIAQPTIVLPVPSVSSVFVSQWTAGAVQNFAPTGTLKSSIAIPASTLTYGLATDGTDLFIANPGPGIYRTPLGSNTPTLKFSQGARELLYDSVSKALFTVGTDTVSIWKCPLSGTSCSLFLPPVTQQLNAVAVAGGKLFVTLLDTVTPASTSTGLFNCSTAGSTCTLTPMLTGGVSPFWMTADSSFAYLRMSAPPRGSGVYRCAVGGCLAGATFVATGPTGIAQIALDATAIYWTGFSETATGRGVYRLAKQP